MKLYNSLRHFSKLSNKKAFIKKILLGILAIIFVIVSAIGILGAFIGLIIGESWSIVYIVWGIITTPLAIILMLKAHSIPYENISQNNRVYHPKAVFPQQITQTPQKQIVAQPNKSYNNDALGGWYDMDTLEGINSIPVPAKNYNYGDGTTDCIYYVLQRKATVHKKAGNMDLAIACLRKSNALSDYYKRPPLLHKDYLRLVKYLELAGKKYEAELELQNLKLKHPEFYDKRISNKRKIDDVLRKCAKYKNDLIFIQLSNQCPICSKYNGVYSISGKNRKYPKIPIEIIRDGGFDSTCIMGVTLYFDDIKNKY